MTLFLNAVGVGLGSYLGWRLGTLAGPTAATAVGALGAGLGLYGAQRLRQAFRV